MRTQFLLWSKPMEGQVLANMRPGLRSIPSRRKVSNPGSVLWVRYSTTDGVPQACLVYHLAKYLDKLLFISS